MLGKKIFLLCIKRWVKHCFVVGFFPKIPSRSQLLLKKLILYDSNLNHDDKDCNRDEKIAEMGCDIAKLTKTVEEKDLQIATFMNKLWGSETRGV